LLLTITVFLVFCVTCLLFFSLWRKMSFENRKLPPGPVPFPILGNLLQLNTKNLSRDIEELSRMYGPVFTIYLGSERVVVLSGYKTVKKALIGFGDEFSRRGSMPTLPPFIPLLFPFPGILRQFVLSTLRNFGMGKRSIEERIQEETCFLVERFRNTHERPFDPSLFLTHAVSNIICSIVFGDRFDCEDKKFVTLIRLIEENGSLQRSHWILLYNFFPTLMDYLPGPHQQIFKNFEAFRRFVQERVKIHKETLDPNCPHDFIDAFLIKMEEEKYGHSKFNEESLAGSTMDLFVGGTESTSSTLKFGLLILLKYPEIEEKVHEEIDRVIGRSTCMADRSQMPYTDAVVHEIQRFISLVPFGVPRAVTGDVRLNQYIIPKGTTIFPFLKSVLYDSTEFPSPEQFNPGHFLDENGAFFYRMCVGESLARVEIFLILTTILQNFILKPVIDPKDIDITPVMSFVTDTPKPYQLCVLPR
uniref:unspecific monooxygenase n=1 Tax=Pelusios castaneus TaxID=367368 RepID=A0A8C8SCM7_9SAUR